MRTQRKKEKKGKERHDTNEREREILIYKFTL